MTVPGSNLLRRATRIIAQSPFTYRPFASRTTNSAGEWISTYGKDVQTKGSLQPVPRDLMVQMGFDLQSAYIVVYVLQTVIDVARDTSGDQILFNNQLYNILSDTRWFPIDGWTAFYAVRVNPDA